MSKRLLIDLSYFKTNGKWYADATFNYTGMHEDVAPDKYPPLYRIWEYVEQMSKEKHLPGLVDGHSDFIVWIQVPDHPHNHPHLIMPVIRDTHGDLVEL